MIRARLLSLLEAGTAIVQGFITGVFVILTNVLNPVILVYNRLKLQPFFIIGLVNIGFLMHIEE
jgi:hypothetical protein